MIGVVWQHQLATVIAIVLKFCVWEPMQQEIELPKREIQD